MRKLLFIVLFAACPAVADVTQGGKTVECYCTDKAGARIELGETICMQVDGRIFLAQCQMSLNSPMWREIGGACLSSSVQQSAPVLASQG